MLDSGVIKEYFDKLKCKKNQKFITCKIRQEDELSFTKLHYLFIIIINDIILSL